MHTLNGREWWHRYGSAFLFGGFGILGIGFFLFVAGITSRARLRDPDFSVRNSGDCIPVNTRAVQGRSLVGDTGGNWYRDTADVSKNQSSKVNSSKSAAK